MSEQQTQSAFGGKKHDPDKVNRMMGYGLVLFATCMVGMAYAAVPLYSIFCQVTGYGGTTQAADEAPVDVISRKMTVRFDANVSGGLSWAFHPATKPVTMKIGETGEAQFEVSNLGNSASTGTATFNVTPAAAGIYFNKLECFCFTEQTVKAGETVSMPVIFFVDPDIDKDPDLKSIDTITLSYTFFPKKRQAASFTGQPVLKTEQKNAGTGS